MMSKYSINIFKYIFFIAALTSITLPAYSELSVEEIIKGRKALFSKNYSTAKKVQTFASKGDFVKASSLMKEMSENYLTLLEYFPDNTNTNNFPYGLSYEAYVYNEYIIFEFV